MRVIVTGSRDWHDEQAVEDALRWLPCGATIVHGGCRGLDRMAARIAKEFNFEVEEYPAAWNRLGKKAGPVRNSCMLADGASLVIAFHHDLENSKGTWDMVHKAWDADVPVVYIRGN